MKFNNILEMIGETPHIRFNSLFDRRVEVWMKAEHANPGGSIKDRIALAMIEDAEHRGLLGPDSLIVEPTSGNTGVGLAIVAAVRGYQLLLVMPESMSIERRRLFAAYGAQLVLTPRELGMRGAIDRASAIVAHTPKAWMPQQFENEVNVEVHRRTTAAEILRDFPDGLDLLVAGVGTGGHISGVSEVLKEHFPRMRTYAVEPADSPVISGGTSGLHRLQGIGAGFVPHNLHLETIDAVVQVSEADAFAYAVRAAREEGILVGPSSGAALAGVAQVLHEIPDRGVVLTFSYDSGERYFSLEGLFDTDGTSVRAVAERRPRSVAATP